MKEQRREIKYEKQVVTSLWHSSAGEGHKADCGYPGDCIASGYLISSFKPEVSFAGGIWWSIVTLTTVGYGDISPSTPEGRTLAVFIMFFGIGLLGVLSASLASLLISMRIKENRGMVASMARNYSIICEWNHRARSIVKELRSNPQTKETAIVLIA